MNKTDTIQEIKETFIKQLEQVMKDASCSYSYKSKTAKMLSILKKRDFKPFEALIYLNHIDTFEAKYYMTTALYPKMLIGTSSNPGKNLLKGILNVGIALGALFSDITISSLNFPYNALSKGILYTAAVGATLKNLLNSKSGENNVLLSSTHHVIEPNHDIKPQNRDLKSFPILLSEINNSKDKINNNTKILKPMDKITKIQNTPMTLNKRSNTKGLSMNI